MRKTVLLLNHLSCILLKITTGITGIFTIISGMGNYSGQKYYMKATTYMKYSNPLSTISYEAVYCTYVLHYCV